MTDELKRLYTRALAKNGISKLISGTIQPFGARIFIGLATEKTISTGEKIKFRGFTRLFFLENIDG